MTEHGEYFELEIVNVPDKNVTCMLDLTYHQRCGLPATHAVYDYRTGHYLWRCLGHRDTVAMIPQPIYGDYTDTVPQRKRLTA